MPKSSKETMKMNEMKVLDVLEQHANENISELGKKCGFSSQKVARIIKNLEKEKRIWGYAAVVDDEIKDFKHYILMVKRNTKPVDAEFKRKVAFEKIDDYLPNLVKIENIYFTYGMYHAVFTFCAANITNAKKFVEEIFNRIGKYLDEYLLLETLFPIRKQGIKNPHLKNLIEFL
jgi:DNA-binding Lrp family transcriptional regulator